MMNYSTHQLSMSSNDKVVRSGQRKMLNPRFILFWEYKKRGCLKNVNISFETPSFK